ncbi:thermonuclease family protein [Lederbergia panacisoli]|uniref:thermonuclease family protein n=1 Tax=Lederbergia panacisoli TaxID=1255251 RepID=UPI00214C721F|nr:thermonuclease family protein [Lederbergia panacisoli]MCR2821664.1 thermonuclease family protein [Lederbergia panacisoli]
MTRLFPYFFILLLILNLIGCSRNTSNRVEVTLAEPIDGDTIAVMYKGEREKVRFLLVDSPETSHPRLGEQPYGLEAKEFTSSLVENANKIEVEFDIGPNQDKYGRLLAYVYLDGKMIQEELLKRGLARVAYIYPPNTRYVDQFDAIQKKAQKDGVGIWEIENYAQEDGFHPETMGSNSEESSKDCLIKGNIGSEKIYHTPDSPWYEQTKPEMMFCTEEEAVKAGFRPPKR